MNTPNRRQTVFNVSSRASPVYESELHKVALETDILFRKLTKKRSKDSGNLLSKYKNRIKKFGKRTSLVCSVRAIIERYRNKEPIGLPASKFRRIYTNYQLACADEPNQEQVR